MKKLLLFLVLFAGCAKGDGGGGIAIGDPEYALLAGKFWRPFQLTHNGTDDPTIFSRQPTYEFRSDGKLYIDQVFPSYHDTFGFGFLNDQNIRLVKPWMDPNFTGNLHIDQLTDTEFDFTSTSNLNSDVDVFKSQKQ